MAGHVFISYSRADQAYVDRLADHFRGCGLPIWFDSAIATGENFGPRIQQAIDDCAAFVVVLTPDSAGSVWVRREISRAARLRKPMRPLLLRSCDLPIELDGMHHEDVTGAQLPSGRFTDELRATVAAAGLAMPVPAARAAWNRRRASLLIAGSLVVSLMIVVGVFFVKQRKEVTLPRILATSVSPSSGPETPLPSPSLSASPSYSPSHSPSPKRILKLDRTSPGCDEDAPEVIWTLVGAAKTCDEGGTTLTKLRSWGEPPGLGFAELRFAVKGQTFPRNYTIGFTVSDLSDPVVGANNGGCASVFVHTTADGKTFEQLDICGSGLNAIVRYVDLADVGRQTESNAEGDTNEIASPVVNTTTAFVSLVMAWRNTGARATFSDFHYTAG
ncbi:hypothetical protein Rhe02_02750 [Rhizocola hellebori]|uniref:TIR domain-containing protein n=2 Tax=Rhizocola hellebori TaxID=1392758 RepID=A0A8J3Q1R9_9ACTN|nr:hypothetical protein Rhe02_02750 [Rhizocola hellebori]